MRMTAATAQPKSSAQRLNQLGGRVRAERSRRQFTLETLSARAGVSQSMLSAIERGTKAPTVLILDRIATALGTSLARLMEDETRSNVILMRRTEQVVAQDPSGWELRLLSPVLPGADFSFMRPSLAPPVLARLA